MTETTELNAVQVAVVIPAYNAAATLADTLDSVLNQTHRNLDIVVVDDGSTDSTREIAASYARQDTRVRVISQPNGGVARARNAGVAATSAEFIAPIDADDLWHPDNIRLQLDCIVRGGPRMGYAYSNHRQVDESGRWLGRNSACVPMEGWVYLRFWVFNCVGNGSALLIRREAFEDIGGYEESLFDDDLHGAEDWLLQILLAARWKVGRVPLFLVGYRKHSAAMTMARERMVRAIMASLLLAAKTYPETPGWLVNQVRAQSCASLAWHSLRRRQFYESGRWISLALAAGFSFTVIRFFWKVLEGISRRFRKARAYTPVSNHPLFLDMKPDEGEPGRLERRQLRQLRYLTPMESGPIGGSSEFARPQWASEA